MNRRIAVGIDVGTSQVKVVVAESQKGSEPPRILGRGFAESKGLRHGYIINSPDVTKSVAQAVREAEKASNLKIKDVYLSVGGIGLSSITSVGTVAIMRGDNEVASADVEKVLATAEAAIPRSQLINRKIIFSVPLQYKIDGKAVLGKPEGMCGVRLEVRALFITSLEQHLNDLIEAVENSGINVLDVMASPIAASFVTLSKTQKVAGCVLANIGSETVSIAIYENNIPISLEVFQIGSTNITNDIALGLKIPLEEAEQIKRGGLTMSNYPKKKLEEIISARLNDIFELIENHLKKIGKNGLLPAGIIITGGGSGVATIEDIAKSALRLPSRIATLNIGDNKSQIKDSKWAVAYGLCIFGLVSEGDRGGNKNYFPVKPIFEKVTQFFKQFLP